MAEEESVNKRPRRAFSSTEKLMMLNMFNSFKTASPSASHNEICKTVASSMGVSWTSIYRVISEKKTNANLRSPKKKKTRLTVCDKIDDFTKCAIRRIIHSFFLRNEIPTLDKVLSKIEEDGSLGSFKRTSLHLIIREIGFKFSKRCRNSMLTDRDDIFFWRRNYLRDIVKAREVGKNIYYLDETWINEGHTMPKVWSDTTITSARAAFMSGLSTGLKNPSGKGKRLIITHVGSEDGFVEGALLVFESKKDGDYHKEMNSDTFENWFKGMIEKLPENSVIVMDNASYH
ncbi:uncharacterized protein LOC105386028 [Plutella xylostella]|uniref:uncharacterized protein LOC105386028 n=1 Tax=Plutella xylostella TaxID=51655 RepID=UPI002032CD3D|nr:uncharacterized protein LOC105386028 [Plutella xylostella]